ncbi:hypothetical protein [Pseudomonas sp. URMO17WK12:I12]|uniref:hypothetical protein n=1 Tax=Pseudomonas sp. URMO17WK12:I12 TaxID=1259797 RepID=UPI000482267A|nr:hypothetical protein [Pseudomonas sp. URMO17WK12:I12]
MTTDELNAQSNVPAHVAILVVPHGVAPNGDMLLGLQITPVPPELGGYLNTDTVNLAIWPQELRTKLKQIHVHLGDVTTKGGFLAKKQLLPIAASTSWSNRAAAAADALWGETFKDGQVTDLIDALREDALSGPSFASSSGISPLIDSHLLATELHIDYRTRVLKELEHGSIAARQLTSDKERLRKWSPPGSALDKAGETIESAELSKIRQAHSDILRSYIHSEEGVSLAANTAMAQLRAGRFSVAEMMARHRAEQLDGTASVALEDLISSLAAASPGRLDNVLEEFALARNVHCDIVNPLPLSTQKEIARRKFSSILTSPSIATFLAVNAELRITREQWDLAVGQIKEGASYGAVAVSFDGTAPGGQGWTAFVHGGEGGPNFFGPCDQAEAIARAAVPNASIVAGVIRLRTQFDGEPRYALHAIDTVNSTIRRMDFARQALAALREGNVPTRSEPNPIGRAIALVDRSIHSASEQSVKRLKLLQSDPDEHINFAADLLRGYSVMFAIPRQQTPDLKSLATEWRTAMGRSITFRSKQQINLEFIEKNVSPEREFGITETIPVQQETTDENGLTKPVVSMPQELFSWHGGSLTVALPTEIASASASISVSEDLAVSRTYNLPDPPAHGEVDYRPPPLRDGRRYIVGLVASYVGGWALNMRDAIAAHAEDKYGHVLGGSAGTPFEFRRPDKIPAPLILLPHDSSMVTFAREKDLQGESLLVLVVRSGDSSTLISRRFFYPDAVNFDQAEQQDQFRGVIEDAPAGAFRADVGVLWRQGGGSFPLAMGGRIATSPIAKDSNSRGQVLKFITSPKPQREYYPDSNSQFLRLHLATQTPADFVSPTMKLPTPFWTDGKRPRQAMPVLLELRRINADSIKPRVTVNQDSYTYHGVKVRRIVVSIQPATVISAMAVAEPTPAVLLQNHLIGEVLLEHTRGLTPASQPPEKMAEILLAVMLQQQVISSLNGLQAIRLVHAQQRPEAPAFIVDQGAITPVVVTVAADSSTSSDRKWIDVVVARWAMHNDRYSRWESDEGGSTCFFVGCVNVDPAATGKLRCEAHWEEHGPEYLKKNSAKSYRYKPGSSTCLLFDVSDIDSATTATRLDLLNNQLVPRRLAHSFPDGRARRLVARLVATSRFTDYFPSVKDCESLSATHEIWVPCTFLPPPPIVAGISFMLKEDYRSDGHGRFSFTRTSRIRMELGTDVYVSGEGEKLGVIFRVDGNDPCDLFTPEFEPYADGFTMEGRNPLHNSVTRGHLGPERFRSGETVVRGILKAQRPGSSAIGGDGGVPVDILPHEPSLDEKKGYYCDVVLDPQNAAQRRADLAAGAPYMPFVHLGLARYQKHAVEGLQLSPAVGRDIWLLPWRHGSIEFSDSRNFVLRIEGPMVDEDLATSPKLEVTVLHNEAVGIGNLWVPARGRIDQLYVADLPPIQASGRTIWEWKGRLPHSRRLRNYGIRVRESARQRDDYTGKIEQRRWVLNMTIDLWSRRAGGLVEIVEPLPK